VRQFAGYLLFWWRYRLKVSGIENLPKHGPVLLLGNHISWIDFALIQWAIPRTIRFVVHEEYYNKAIFKWVLILVGAVPIKPANSRNAMYNIVKLLDADCVVGMFPEGQISTDGEFGELKRGFEKILSESKDSVFVVPFAVNDMWGTFFSKAPKTIKRKQKFCLRRDIHINIGPPLDAKANRLEVRNSISELLI